MPRSPRRLKRRSRSRKSSRSRTKKRSSSRRRRNSYRRAAGSSSSHASGTKTVYLIGAAFNWPRYCPIEIGDDVNLVVVDKNLQQLSKDPDPEEPERPWREWKDKGRLEFRQRKSIDIPKDAYIVSYTTLFPEPPFDLDHYTNLIKIGHTGAYIENIGEDFFEQFEHLKEMSRIYTECTDLLFSEVPFEDRTHPPVSYLNSLIHKVDTKLRESAQSKSDVRLFMADLLWSRVNDYMFPYYGKHGRGERLIDLWDDKDHFLKDAYGHDHKPSLLQKVKENESASSSGTKRAREEA